MSARVVRTGIAGAAAISALLALAPAVHARPSYFETFAAHYGIGPADDLHACGVCHYNWEGTGARNPYGQEVEQQLYTGKTVTQSLIDKAKAKEFGARAIAAADSEQLKGQLEKLTKKYEE